MASEGRRVAEAGQTCQTGARPYAEAGRGRVTAIGPPTFICLSEAPRWESVTTGRPEPRGGPGEGFSRVGRPFQPASHCNSRDRRQKVRRETSIPTTKPPQHRGP